MYLKAIRKRQSSHTLVVGNWDITSLTRKKHELVEEAKRYSLDVDCISSTNPQDSYVVEPGDGWKFFYVCVEPTKHVQARVKILVNYHLVEGCV